MEAYQKLSKLMEQVAKTTMEIKEIEWEMYSRNMLVRKITWRPMVEVPLETEGQGSTGSKPS